MGTVIENSGTGSFGDVAAWSMTETATPLLVGETGVGFGDGSLTVARQADTELAIDNELAIVHPLLGRARLKVNNVSLATPKTAVLSADSLLGRFISGSVSIPGVESGSPYAALDMACQLAGTRRYTPATKRTSYWSLAGHTAGFDSDGKLVRPTGVDRIYGKKNIAYDYASGYKESVRYQEISGLVTAVLNPFYPISVTGPTLRLRSARTYIKATTANALTSGNIVFSFTTGPDFRHYPDGVVRDSTVSVSVTYTRATGTFAVVISYRDTAGNAATATASSATAAFLAAGLQTVAVEVYLNSANQLVVRGGVVDSTGATISTGPLAATTAAFPAAIAPIYTSRFTFAASSSQLKDLVIRETGSADDQWASFYTSNYVDPIAPFTSALGDLRTGSPIAGTTGELWDYLKQVASGRAVEIAPVGDALVLREAGTRTMSLDDSVTVSRGISTATVGRNIAIVNQNTTAPTGPTIVQESTQNYSVGVGEVAEYDLTGIDSGIRWIYSPAVTFDAKTLPDFSWPLGTTVPNAAFGTYTVTAQDHLPVSPTAWSYYGGGVTASINAEGVAHLTVTGPSTAIPGVNGPFTLSLSDGVTDYPSLKLAGVGVLSRPITITIPTGADPARTNVELAATINNVAICDAATAYNRAAWAAVRASGPVTTLTATISMLTLGSFGVGAGSLVKYDAAVYRVDSLTINSSGTATISASKRTTVADYQALGITETAGTFAVRWAGKSLADFAIRPLQPVI